MRSNFIFDIITVRAFMVLSFEPVAGHAPYTNDFMVVFKDNALNLELMYNLNRQIVKSSDFVPNVYPNSALPDFVHFVDRTKTDFELNQIIFSHGKQHSIKFFTSGTYVSKFGATAVMTESNIVVIGGSVEITSQAGFQPGIISTHMSPISILGSGVIQPTLSDSSYTIDRFTQDISGGSVFGISMPRNADYSFQEASKPIILTKVRWWQKSACGTAGDVADVIMVRYDGLPSQSYFGLVGQITEFLHSMWMTVVFSTTADKIDQIGSEDNYLLQFRLPGDWKCSSDT